MEFQTILSYLSCPSFSGCAGIASALNSSAFRQAELLDKAGSSTKIPLEASARKKKKRHRCEKCMLVVFDVLNIYEPIDHDGWQNADQSSIAARVSGGLEWDTLFLQDLIWDGQAGPKCAAASVSSLALSFASTYGLPGSTPEGTPLSQASVLKTYERMKVANIQRTTAAVGNAQWRQAIALTAIAGSSLRMVPRPLSAQFASSQSVANELWKRMTRELSTGNRIMYHCNNHYVRVFGFRSGWHPVDTLRPVLKECHTELGGDSGDEDGPQRHKPSSNTQSSSLAAWEGLRALNPLVAQLLASASCEAQDCPPTASQPPARVLRREILTARRGQRPKHWVNWEQVVCDIQQHKIHCLLVVKPTAARGLQQSPPFIHKSSSL